ncbi:MAG: hypothetical protein IH881_11645 [Myxococcales bacterium]|nr:hypothetical protein [Myxococcales bacterium]
MSAVAIADDYFIATECQFTRTAAQDESDQSTGEFFILYTNQVEQKIESLNKEIPIVFHTSSRQTLEAFLQARMRQISEVENIEIAEREKDGQLSVHVWTYLSKDDKGTRFRVYDIEQELIELLPDILFEFHVHRGRPASPGGDETVYNL